MYTWTLVHICFLVFLVGSGCQFWFCLPKVIHLHLLWFPADRYRSYKKYMHLLSIYHFSIVVIKAQLSNMKAFIPGPVALQSTDGCRSQFLHCWTRPCRYASSRNREGSVWANSWCQSADNGPWPNHFGNSALSSCSLQQKKEAYGLLWLWTVSFTFSAQLCEAPCTLISQGLNVLFLYNNFTDNKLCCSHFRERQTKETNFSVLQN